jgi:hypothetical protein
MPKTGFVFILAAAAFYEKNVFCISAEHESYSAQG